LSFAACKKREKPIDPESARIVEEAVRRELRKYQGEITDEDRRRVTHLFVYESTITDLRPLTNLPHLKELSLDQCYILTDLTPLSKLSELQRLSLEGCKDLSDLRPLNGLRNLSNLFLLGSTAIKEIPAPLLYKANVHKPNGKYSERAATPLPTTEPPAV